MWKGKNNFHLLLDLGLYKVNKYLTVNKVKDICVQNNNLKISTVFNHL